MEALDTRQADVASWTCSYLGGAHHLSVRLIRGLVATKPHSPFAAVPEEIWRAGLYQGICDQFNGGLEIEDLDEAAAEVLGLVMKGLELPA